MAYHNSSHGGRVMRNHGSQPPHRPAPFPRCHVWIIRNNPRHTATMNGQALRNLVTHDIFIRQAPAPFYDGGAMVVDALPVSSTASHGGSVTGDPHSASFSGLITITHNINDPPNSHRQAPAPFYDGGVMVLDDRPVSSAAGETADTPQTVNGLSKEVISRFLKTTVIEKPAAADGGGDPEVCSVCLDLYREKQRIGVLGCRHQFHADCIGEWLQKKNVCPLCKAVGIVRNQD
ncbi:hypothetical protein C2S53_008597 [Perilla frutescens var. hirtella]|uniref:RING-type E3 ubiquitin transferase n=1 Tax=Perilla frutescens var. hirtella TaxID=608512 RepID=A0AAD4JN33_PERFH|nr:hypothetical protein C2S53_008597 [Perilla frutescens var. hirtella]